MKTLLVLRHGHAASESEAASDHERELTSRGVAEVRRSVAQVLDLGTLPTLILSSTAVRARQSAELSLGILSSRPRLELLEGLYLAPPASYFAALSARGAEHTSVMVVGHNPGLEQLVATLTERSEHLATASLVEIELALDSWTELPREPRGLGRIVHAFRA